MKRVLARSLILVSIFIACRGVDENPLRDASRFAEIYAEILVATRTAHHAQTRVSLDSVAHRARVDSVLETHHLNRKQLAEAVSYFSANPEQWQIVYQNVIQKLDSLSRQTDGRVPHSFPQPQNTIRGLDKKDEQN